MKYTQQSLMQFQSLPLEGKIDHAKRRIREWYELNNGKVSVSFSGGKDSTVLLHIVRSMYPDVPAVFVDTGLEYPEIKEFVKSVPNCIILRPEKTFKEVIDTEGYPVVSKKVAKMIRMIREGTAKNSINLYLTGITKDGKECKRFKLAKKWRYLIDSPFKISEKCCDIMKKKPLLKYEKETGNKPYIGTMAEDSMFRKSQWFSHGCNLANRHSNPLSIWKQEDIWDYIKKYKLPYCKIYDTGVHHTGCIYCMFGLNLEKKPNRFDLMKNTHPSLYYYCMNKLNLKQILKLLSSEGIDADYEQALSDKEVRK